MKKLLIIGCSHSYGQLGEGLDHIMAGGWTWDICKKYDIETYVYSTPGGGIQNFIFYLNYIINTNEYKKYDKILIQLTGEPRIKINLGLLSLDFKYTDENFFRLDASWCPISSNYNRKRKYHTPTWADRPGKLGRLNDNLRKYKDKHYLTDDIKKTDVLQLGESLSLVVNSEYMLMETNNQLMSLDLYADFFRNKNIDFGVFKYYTNENIINLNNLKLKCLLKEQDYFSWIWKNFDHKFVWSNYIIDNGLHLTLDGQSHLTEKFLKKELDEFLI